MTNNEHRIIVVGAGYAGLTAALRLAPGNAVTLIAPGRVFTERVRLHELAAGSRASAAHPLARFLAGTGVRHVAARAVALDPEAREVTTDTGETFGYDRLVYAAGSRTAAPDDPRVRTVEQASDVRTRPGTVAVVGGGLTGVELAAELAETRPGVTLITEGELAPDLSSQARAYLRAALTRLGVAVTEGRRVAPADVDADTLVWAAAMTPNTEPAVAAGLAADANGRLRVDAALRSVSHPDVVVAGDAAAGLRMACATAIPTGSRAASTVRAELRGDAPDPLRFRYYAKCVSLGRSDGLLQFLDADDAPRDRVWTGRRAAWTKEQIVLSTTRMIRLARRAPRLSGRLPGLG
ncbi:NAD(P)/FAD-dependent oxidoreductase [Actinomadura atramentaria]|uniref:NAD(P)/FAD-dependent oxidoreductase n=1 Tax=Actinomadura atramentaria TaxID=1990 RepID=UPI00039F9F50|nr:FAD-dependent oxidoreductase [Actinomadura atramentaria]